jgi:amidohydrolase
MDSQTEDGLISLRRKLHSTAELSGNERDTAAMLREVLLQSPPTELREGIAGNGLLAIHDSGLPGPSVLLRCDMDALPIPDDPDLSYTSRDPDVSHRCGHDGHMAIMVGVSSSIAESGLDRGKALLLFQPSEETGEGAAMVLSDPAFTDLHIDYAFALHNMPGFPAQSIVAKPGPYAASSRGLIVRYHGAFSHAAEPEKGSSPVPAAAFLMLELGRLPQSVTSLEGNSKVTVIHASIGSRAFGTSPGEAVVMATLRSYAEEVMDQLADRAVELAQRLGEAYDLRTETSWTELFPATINDAGCVRVVEKAATEAGLEFVRPEGTFPWSEDFGNFTSAIPGALFGLGAGQDHPNVHSRLYDFPDGILASGVRIFEEIIHNLLGTGGDR